MVASMPSKRLALWFGVRFKEQKADVLTLSLLLNGTRINTSQYLSLTLYTTGRLQTSKNCSNLLAGIARCDFCNGPHLSSKCPRYATDEDRRRRARGMDRCTRCLSRKHSSSYCDHEDKCSHCSGRHLLSLCPRKCGQWKSE